MKWLRRCDRCWRVHKTGTNGLTKCRTGRGDRSYRAMANAYIGHSARWKGKVGKQRRARCARHSGKGIWRCPRSWGGHGGSCGTRECRHGSNTWTKCARRRYGEGHVKLEGGRIKEEAK